MQEEDLKYKQDHEKTCRNQVNGGGSLVPLIQCTRNSWRAYVPQPELSFRIPVESYQSFDFVNFMVDGRPCFLQMDIKTPP
jgi:hypothetical protein